MKIIFVLFKTCSRMMRLQNVEHVIITNTSPRKLITFVQYNIITMGDVIYNLTWLTDLLILLAFVLFRCKFFKTIFYY